MYIVIKKLKRDRDAAEFVNFVDEGRAEGYYKIIGYPMCLQEIEDRIKRHQCDSREVVWYSSSQILILFICS